MQRLSSVESANIDICALSEVRRPGSEKISLSEVIPSFGVELKQKQLALVLQSQTFAAQSINPVPISNRLVQIQLRNGERLTLISMYAPTMQRTQEDKENFHEKLGSCVAAAKDNFVIILGDLNARVGKD